MSALVNLSRPPATLLGFQLLVPEDFWTAFNWLTANGYTGNLNCYPEGAGLAWNVSFARPPSGNSQVAYLNDWLVLENGTEATAYRNVVFQSLFVIG